MNEAHQAMGDAGLGNQIRSYVLQPCRMVEGPRTGVETSNTRDVRDGFIAATGTQQAAGKSRAEAQGEYVSVQDKFLENMSVFC